MNWLSGVAGLIGKVLDEFSFVSIVNLIPNLSQETLDFHKDLSFSTSLKLFKAAEEMEENEDHLVKKKLIDKVNRTIDLLMQIKQKLGDDSVNFNTSNNQITDSPTKMFLNMNKNEVEIQNFDLDSLRDDIIFRMNEVFSQHQKLTMNLFHSMKNEFKDNPENDKNNVVSAITPNSSFSNTNSLNDEVLTLMKRIRDLEPGPVTKERATLLQSSDEALVATVDSLPAHHSMNWRRQAYFFKSGGFLRLPFCLLPPSLGGQPVCSSLTSYGTPDNAVYFRCYLHKTAHLPTAPDCLRVRVRIFVETLVRRVSREHVCQLEMLRADFSEKHNLFQIMDLRAFKETFGNLDFKVQVYFSPAE